MIPMRRYVRQASVRGIRTLLASADRVRTPNSTDRPADCRLDRNNAAEQLDGVTWGASLLLMVELLALSMID